MSESSLNVQEPAQRSDLRVFDKTARFEMVISRPPGPFFGIYRWKLDGGDEMAM